MATSTIQKLPQIQEYNPSVNENYVTAAGNHLKIKKWGRVCMIYGYFNNIVEVPYFTTIIFLPHSCYPLDDFSLRIQNDSENYWLFATSRNAEISSQDKSIPVGNHYLTCFYLSTY